MARLGTKSGFKVALRLVFDTCGRIWSVFDVFILFLAFPIDSGFRILRNSRPVRASGTPRGGRELPDTAPAAAVDKHMPSAAAARRALDSEHRLGFLEALSVRLGTKSGSDTGTD